MIRLAIVVEGQTEEEFVNKVLASHLRTRAVEPTPVLVGRGVPANGPSALGSTSGSGAWSHWITNELVREAMNEHPARHADERRRDVLRAAADLWADRIDLAQLDDARASLDRDLPRIIRPPARKLAELRDRW